ncbi:lipoprotein [Streptomyces odonnellii]|uniref:lipoprotein n=1 Tax=Streptomyces odonnellii TaxID=1417980 RepID=UPI00062504FA|nr:lipoprotein [Streptomyces odonnellii]
MKHIRAGAWVGITFAVLAATTACGTEAARKTADAVGHADAIMAALTRASDKASGFGSAEVETTTEIAASRGKPVAMDGTYSWGDGAALDVEMDTASAQMQSVQDDPTLTMKMVDGAYYYEVDPQPSGPLKGKHWMRIDVSAVVGEAGANSIADNADPTAGLRYIGASKDVMNLGEETVRGKKATHYRGSIGTQQVNASGLTAQEKKAAVKSLEASGGKVSLDIWVDGKDLPVRVKQSGGGMTVTMDYLKFGGIKPITAPPAADTADLTDEVEKQRDQSLNQ